jgi:hypothetical protein
MIKNMKNNCIYNFFVITLQKFLEVCCCFDNTTLEINRKIDLYKNN